MEDHPIGWDVRPNSFTRIVEYFSTPDKPLKLSEFMAFWQSLTWEERNYYRRVDLDSLL